MKLLIPDGVGNDIYIYKTTNIICGGLVRADIIDKLWNTVERTLLFI